MVIANRITEKKKMFFHQRIVTHEKIPDDRQQLQVGNEYTSRYSTTVVLFLDWIFRWLWHNTHPFNAPKWFLFLFSSNSFDQRWINVSHSTALGRLNFQNFTTAKQKTKQEIPVARKKKWGMKEKRKKNCPKMMERREKKQRWHTSVLYGAHWPTDTLAGSGTRLHCRVRGAKATHKTSSSSTKMSRSNSTVAPQ